MAGKLVDGDGLISIRNWINENFVKNSAGAEITQNDSFLVQGTATKNNTVNADVINPNAELSEKRGNTVCVNQKRQSMNATSGAIAHNEYHDLAFPAINGYHTVLCIFSLNVTTMSSGAHVAIIGLNSSDEHKEITKRVVEGKNLLFICTELKNYPGYNSLIARLYNNDNENALVYQDADVRLIDLTQWFNGNENIPEDLLDHPENFFRYYQGNLSYNEGTLVNANSRYLKAIGRQQLDGEYEAGYINGNGVPYALNNTFRTKNYIKVVPNAQYHLHLAYSIILNGVALFVEYDKDKNFIKVEPKYSTSVVYTPSPNCCYLKLAFYQADSSWHTNIPTPEESELTLSLYYSGETGYDQYYPYELLTDNDTGSEELLAFDYKEPSGLIHRDTIELELSNLNWVYDSSNKQFYSELLGNVVVDGYVVCEKYFYNASGYFTIDTPHTRGVIGNRIYIIDETLNGDTSLITGKIQVHKTPTTEQGTSFPRGIFVENMGSMEFSGTSGVPQGCSITYSSSYSLLLNNLTKYVNADPESLALKSYVRGTNDGTYWTTITINGVTKAIGGGGGGGSGYLPLSAGAGYPLTGDLYVKGVIRTASGSGDLTLKTEGGDAVSIQSAAAIEIIAGNANNHIATISNSAFTESRTFELPNKSGTFALLSDINGYVPYTGATADVNLGTHTLNANYLAITSNPSDLTNVTVFGKTYIQYIRTVNNVTKIANFQFPDKTGNPTFAMTSDIKIYWHTITITEGSYSAYFTFQTTSATPIASISDLNSYFATEKYLPGNYYEPNTSSQLGIPYNYMISSVCKSSGTNVGKFSVNYKSTVDSINQTHYFSTSATVSDVVEEA